MEIAKSTNDDMHGEVSSIRTLGGSGKGMLMMEMDLFLKRVGLMMVEVVVMMVTETWRSERMREKWRRGMVWPCDMNGNKTKCGGVVIVIMVVVGGGGDGDGDDGIYRW